MAGKHRVMAIGGYYTDAYKNQADAVRAEPFPFDPKKRAKRLGK